MFLSVIAIFFQGCILFRVTRVESNGDTPPVYELTGDISFRSTGNVNIAKKEFFPASFMIEASGKVIYIDPVAIDTGKTADYIFITHPHIDHLSKPDLEKIIDDETLIIGPRTVAGKLSKYNVKQVAPGDEFDLEDIRVEVVPAYNLAPVFLWFKAHSEKELNAGYVLTMGEIRLYHPGDSDFIPEMSELKDITVMLVPLCGDNLTMDVESGADAVNTIRPKIAVPMHYETGQNVVERFSGLVSHGIEIVSLEIP